jgi:hypothetical protein
MNEEEKRIFVANLCDDIRNSILRRVERMPDEWDGIELRQFIADEFQAEATISRRNFKGNQRRLRLYHQAIYNNNLIR